MKTPKIKSLKKSCDTAFSISVRKYGRCQFEKLDKVRCSSVLQCAHIETRGNNFLRYNQQNALCLCSGHHWYYTNHPAAFNKMVSEFFPSQWKYVEAHRHDLIKRKLKDYQELLEELKHAV